MKLYVFPALAFGTIALAAPFLEASDRTQEHSLPNANVKIVRDDDTPQEYRQMMNITMGTLKANIGTLTGPQIYDRVWHTLDGLCPSMDKCNIGGEHTALITVPYFDRNKINPNGKMSVYIENAHFTIDDAERRLFLGVIAGTVQSCMDNPKNCHKESDQWEFEYTFCNIPDFIRVALNGDATRFGVRFKSVMKSHSGHFDCVGTCEAAGNHLKSLIPEWENEIGSKMNYSVYCPNKEVSEIDESANATAMA